MSSLKADFNELRERIRQSRELNSAGFEPIYYLIFAPTQILEVKRQTPAWIARLKIEGWTIHVFSIAEQIEAILQADLRRPLWLKADRAAPQEWDKANQSIANALVTNNTLQTRLESVLAPLEGSANSLVLVTDLEALHPYLRIGALETRLQGQFHVPTIFLYPGVRTGSTRLKFLGFYPEDGNYRSVHIGG